MVADEIEDNRYVMVSGGKVFLKNLPTNMIAVTACGNKRWLWMHGKNYEIKDLVKKEITNERNRHGREGD